MAATQPSTGPATAETPEHLRFLRCLFGDETNGLIEICGIQRGRLRAKHFDVGDLEMAAAFAERINAHGFNAYYGVAVRNQQAPLASRATDRHFQHTNWAWADIDDEEPALNASQAWRRQPPHIVVQTATTPHVRLQALWRLDQPLTNPDELRSLQAGIAGALQGDTSVVNPTRIMRLPGLTNYAHEKKAKGRVDELVTVEYTL